MARLLGVDFFTREARSEKATKIINSARLNYMGLSVFYSSLSIKGFLFDVGSLMNHELLSTNGSLVQDGILCSADSLATNGFFSLIRLA